MVAHGTRDPQCLTIWSVGCWLHPLLHIEELKVAFAMETRIDSPETHPLGLCRIPALLAGQFDSWPKSSSDLHFSEQAIVRKAQRLSQKTCEKIPSCGSRRSLQPTCNPEDIDLYCSVRAESLHEAWIVVCFSPSSLGP